jgi:hypothetical protein
MSNFEENNNNEAYENNGVDSSKKVGVSFQTVGSKIGYDPKLSNKNKSKKVLPRGESEIKTHIPKVVAVEEGTKEPSTRVINKDRFKKKLPTLNKKAEPKEEIVITPAVEPEEVKEPETSASVVPTDEIVVDIPESELTLKETPVEVIDEYVEKLANIPEAEEETKNIEVSTKPTEIVDEVAQGTLLKAAGAKPKENIVIDKNPVEINYNRTERIFVDATILRTKLFPLTHNIKPENYDKVKIIILGTSMEYNSIDKGFKVDKLNNKIHITWEPQSDFDYNLLDGSKLLVKYVA